MKLLTTLACILIGTLTSCSMRYHSEIEFQGLLNDGQGSLQPIESPNKTTINYYREAKK